MKKIFVALLLLSCLTLALTPLAESKVIVYPNIYFPLPTTDTYVNFASTTTLTSANRIGEYWYFNGLGFTSINCNVTINELFNPNMDKISLTTKKLSDDQTVNILLPSTKGTPTYVSNSNGWSFNTATNLLTINTTATTQTVVISWEEVTSPTSEPTGEPSASPTGEPTSEPTGEPTATPTDGFPLNPSASPTQNPIVEFENNTLWYIVLAVAVATFCMVFLLLIYKRKI